MTTPTSIAAMHAQLDREEGAILASFAKITRGMPGTPARALYIRAKLETSAAFVRIDKRRKELLARAQS